jgi:ABC-type amino acid transport system permease subunit
MEVFLSAGVFYLVLVSIAGWLLHVIEDRLGVPGFEQHRI